MPDTMMQKLLRGIIVLVAGFCLAAPVSAADPVRINGSGNGLDLMKPLIEAYVNAHPGARFEMDKPLGSSGAIKALLAGAMDIVVSSRALKPAEVKAGAVLAIYGRTPLAMVTHTDVNKKDLTTQELVDIYSGKTMTWPDGKPIRLILRPLEDADTKLIRKLSPEMDAAMASAQSRPGMTIAKADKLRIRVVVEGVETLEQVAFLHPLGCQLIQGYYFYRPLEEEAFLKLLA